MSNLVKRSNRKPRFLRELHDREADKGIVVDRVKNLVLRYHHEGYIFKSTKEILQRFKDDE